MGSDHLRENRRIIGPLNPRMISLGICNASHANLSDNMFGPGQVSSRPQNAVKNIKEDAPGLFGQAIKAASEYPQLSQNFQA